MEENMKAAVFFWDCIGQSGASRCTQAARLLLASPAKAASTYLSAACVESSVAIFLSM